MIYLDDYISDLQTKSTEMLDEYVTHDCKNKKAIKKFISLEIIKHLDKASIKIENKLKEFHLAQLKDKECK